jgi:hypothetical protein
MDPVPEDEFSHPQSLPYQPPPGPEPMQVIGGALREGNWLVNALTRQQVLTNPPVEGYSFWDDIKNNPMWVAHAPEFAGSRSPQETQQMGQRIDQGIADRRVLASSGAMGYVAGAVNFGLDPTWILPGKIAMTVFKETKPWVQGALETGAGFGIQAGVSEALLAGQYDERTAGERLTSVGTATILGALLGSGASFLAPGRFEALTKTMDGERARGDANVQGRPMPGPEVKLGDDAVGRPLQSDSPTARRATHDFVEAAATAKVDTDGKPSTLGGGPSLEVMSNTEQGVAAARLHDALQKEWTDYAANPKPPDSEPITSFEQFGDLVGDALMANGKHDIPQVARAAEQARPMFEEMSGRAEKAVPDFKRAELPEGEGFFPHKFNKTAIKADREKFEADLTDHLAANQEPPKQEPPKQEPPKSSAFSNFSYDEGSKTLQVTFTKTGKTYLYEGVPKEDFDKFAAAPSAGQHFNAHIKPTYKGRLKEEEPATPLAPKPDASLQALRARATKLTDDILAMPDDRLPRVDDRPVERVLDVSNAWARPWIERNVEKAWDAYAKTFTPDVLLSERFGDPAASKVFEAVAQDHAVRAVGEGEEAAATAAQAGDLADLALQRDRLRGLHTVTPEAPVRNIGDLAAAAHALASAPRMGLEALQSVPEIAAALTNWGLDTVFRDAWQPLLQSLMTDEKLAREASRQAQVMGLALDAARNPAPHIAASTAETTLQAGADPLALVKMIQPQIDVLHTAAGVVSSTGIYRAAKAAAKGTATENQLIALERAGIPEGMWSKIADEYEASGTKVDSVLLPNTEKWTSQEARAAFETAIQRDINLGVVNPGIDRPGFIGAVALGMIGQLKEFFGASATRTLMANLPRADAEGLLKHVMWPTAVSLLSYKLEAMVTGKKTSKDPKEWLGEALKHSELGWLTEGTRAARVVKAAEKSGSLFRAVDGKKSKHERDANRSMFDQVVGPSTMDKLDDMSGGNGGTTPGTWTGHDVTARRRLHSTQGLHWLHRTLDKANRNLGPP